MQKTGKEKWEINEACVCCFLSLTSDGNEQRSSSAGSSAGFILSPSQSLILAKTDRFKYFSSVEIFGRFHRRSILHTCSLAESESCVGSSNEMIRLSNLV